MKLVLLGPPGAGKGTLAEKLARKYEIPAISTGDLFRKTAASGSDLGKELKAIMQRGELVPDTLTISVVRDRLSNEDAGRGYLLDGFPRTIQQAEALSGFAALNHVLNLVISDDAIIERLSGRRICPQCGEIYHIKYMPPKVDNRCDNDGADLTIRDDDKIEAIKNRLKVYKKQTEPLIEYYRNTGLLKDLDASLKPEGVLARAIETLGH